MASSWGADIGLLITRVFAGVMIANAGGDKFPTTAWFVDDVANLGFPAPRLFAFAAVASEFVGGWLLVLGVLTRPATLLLAVTMGVASFGSHADVPLFAVHVARLLLLIFVCLLLVGPGRLSVDHAIRSGRLPARAALLLGLTMVVTAGYRELSTPIPTPAAPAEIASLSVAGSFNNWDLSATPMTRGADGLWRASVEIDTPGPIEFKFAANGSWELNAGDADNAPGAFPLDATAAVSLDSQPGNIAAYAPRAGWYEFTFDTESYRYTLDGAASPPESAENHD